MLKQMEDISVYSKNLKVLYAEDDPVARENILVILKDMFNDVIIAKDGKEAFEIVQGNKIDLLITDILMPKLNGIELIKKIREKDKNISIIILSQYNESEVLLQSIKLKVDGYILKPVEIDQFVDTIEKVVEKFKFEYETKVFRHLLSQYLTIVDKSNIISKTDIKGRITYVNDSFCKISGYTKDELMGKNHNIIRHPENPKELYKNMWETIKLKKQPWEGVLKNSSKSGKSYYVKTIITPVKDLDGEVYEYISIRDAVNAIIDDKKYLYEKIEQNHLSILALLQIEEFDMLDKFYSRAMVDQVEKNFAYNLFSYLPKGYSFENVYSLGEGKFALLTDFNDFHETGLMVEDYFNKFVQNVRESTLKFDEMEFDLNITLSYAVGKYMLFEDAKAGLDRASNENSKLSFSNDHSIMVSEEAKQNLEMIKTVKIALENYNIISYFQPIINNHTKEVEKYESLVRLIDEDGNIISPFAFLNISKKGNYYNKITERVLENSFKILHKINTKLSINLSASDIEKEQTRNKIFDLLDEYPEDNDRVIFEFLEDEDIKDFQVIISFIKKVKKRGVKIAIDDFGTGYSNFERLLEFEPDILKIDGSLIKSIDKDDYCKNIVETIVLFAKKQNIETIAEFVENEEIFNILHNLGVDYSQGYYFGKPQEYFHLDS